jgi:hypothetical protein
MCITQVAINAALFWSSDIHSLLQNKAYYSILFLVLFHEYMARTLNTQTGDRLDIETNMLPRAIFKNG